MLNQTLFNKTETGCRTAVLTQTEILTLELPDFQRRHFLVALNQVPLECCQIRSKI